MKLLELLNVYWSYRTHLDRRGSSLLNPQADLKHSNVEQSVKMYFILQSEIFCMHGPPAYPLSSCHARCWPAEEQWGPACSTCKRNSEILFSPFSTRDYTTTTTKVSLMLDRTNGFTPYQQRHLVLGRKINIMCKSLICIQQSRKLYQVKNIRIYNTHVKWNTTRVQSEGSISCIKYFKKAL